MEVVKEEVGYPDSVTRNKLIIFFFFAKIERLE